MLTEKQIEILRSENELLQLQLDDVNYMINVREQELDILRQTAKEAVAMQSQLDNNLNEFDQMQRNIGKCEQKNVGQEQRLQEMENELYQSIKEQLSYAETLKAFNSMEASLLDTTEELTQASAVYKKLAAMKTQVAQSQSNLDIALLEIESLKEDLKEAKALNEFLMQKRKGA
jgi:chaperonin cofactor prefoldin